jgi:hypothetical protein
VTFSSSGSVLYLDPADESRQEDVTSTSETSDSGKTAGPFTRAIAQKKMDVSAELLKELSR